MSSPSKKTQTVTLTHYMGGWWVNGAPGDKAPGEWLADDLMGAIRAIVLTEGEFGHHHKLTVTIEDPEGGGCLTRQEVADRNRVEGTA